MKGKGGRGSIRDIRTDPSQRKAEAILFDLATFGGALSGGLGSDEALALAGVLAFAGVGHGLAFAVALTVIGADAHDGGFCGGNGGNGTHRTGGEKGRGGGGNDDTGSSTSGLHVLWSPIVIIGVGVKKWRHYRRTGGDAQ